MALRTRRVEGKRCCSARTWFCAMVCAMFVWVLFASVAAPNNALGQPPLDAKPDGGKREHLVLHHNETLFSTSKTHRKELPALTTVAMKVQTTKRAPKPAAKVSSKVAPLMIALAAGLDQMEDVLVVINSAVAHASQPERLHFRIVTLAAEADELLRELTSKLSRKLNLETAAFDAWLPRVSQLLGGKSSSRKELFDELNFAAFYLHELFPNAPGDRVLYLDVDTVVLADVAAELSERDLGENALAVSRDCSQRVGKYIDFSKLKKQGIHKEIDLHIDPNACVVNRGVVLVHTKPWQKKNITGAIEALVRAHLTKGVGPLWRSGVSQPPFLLAVNQLYHDLGPEYNVRGLGRGDIGPEEINYYRKNKLWTPYLDQFVRKCKFHCCPGCENWSFTPYISANAHKAKILHFNGKIKPKKAGRRSANPLPVPPKNIDKKSLEEREERPLCSCGDSCVQECAGIWWKYFPT